MKIVYSPEYEVNFGGHVFPTSKYRLIKEKLVNEKIVKEDDFILPPPGADEEILLVHTPGYCDKIKKCNLSKEETTRLEIPLTREIADLYHLFCGGTTYSCFEAIEEGIGLHCGGGMHHAYPDHGEGFCVFNDIAVGIKAVMKAKKIGKAMVIDCDLHQGNGTAYIFRDDLKVFTFSIHQGNIYPFPKEISNLDINLPPNTTDEQYLNKLKRFVPEMIDIHKPELIVYVAGADPFEGDQLGQLKMTKEGLLERDNSIKNLTKSKGIPVAVTLAGGYAIEIKDTVEIQANTLKTFI